MAELATIARPYAEALYKACGSDLGGTVVWLDELAVIAANVQLQLFAGNPGVMSAQVFELISGVAQSKLPEAAKTVFWKFSVGAILLCRIRSTSAGVPYSAMPSSPKITGDALKSLMTSALALAKSF